MGTRVPDKRKARQDSSRLKTIRPILWSTDRRLKFLTGSEKNYMLKNILQAIL